jgi:outer membrane protein assembly factor BamB
MGRERRCPRCDDPCPRRASFCGRCGDPLASPSRRALAVPAPLLVTVAALAVLALLPTTSRWSLPAGDTASGDAVAGDVDLPAPTSLEADRTDAAALEVGAVTSDPGLRCLDEAACLAWQHAHVGSDRALVDVAIGVSSIAVATAGQLSLLDAWTGAERWQVTADLSQPPSVAVTEGLVVAVGARGGLLVYTADDGRQLTVRETPAATSASGPLTQARRYDGRVAVVRATEGGHHHLVVVDLATGTSTSVSRRAEQLVLARSGPVFHLGEGRLESRDAVTGSTRWSGELGWAPAELVVLGDRVVALGGTEVAVLDAADGEIQLDRTLDGDEVTTLVRPGEGIAVAAGSDVLFLDRTGATWEVPLDGCCRAMSFTEDTVTLLLDDGTSRTLARADGGPRALRADLPAVPSRAALLDGGLVLRPTPEGGWVVADARTTRDLAETSGAVVGSTRDGALVVVTGASVAAIARPDGAEPPRRYGFARRCSSGAPGGCGFGG